MLFEVAEMMSKSRNGRAKRSVVGVRFPTWWGFGPQAMAGVVDYMREQGSWRLVTENDSVGEMEAVRLDGDWEGDGLIAFRATQEELQQHREAGRAVVLLSTEGVDLGFPRVVPDNKQVGELAAEHLIECSHEHFAFLARGETFYREAEFVSGVRVYARERLRGFRDKLREYQRDPQVHYLMGRPLWEQETWREVQAEVMAFLDALPQPCGLFVADDSLGAVVLRAADELGRQVPEELAVLSFGDDPSYCFSCFPALSAIPYPVRRMGYLAAELLAGQMVKRDLNYGVTRVPVTKISERESSDMLAIPDVEIAELVRWVRRRAQRDPIRVSELVGHSELSLTTIKERFAEYLGHGPKQEIMRVRLNHLEHVLRQTELPLSKIAKSMGFPSAHELSRFFLREKGERPTSYRQREQLPMTRSDEGKAVVFDMDGTLFDTEPLFCEAFQDALRKQGGELDDEEYFSNLAGTTNRNIEDYFDQKCPQGLDRERFRSDWEAHWRLLVSERGLDAAPGISELLETLQVMGVPLAIASSSDRADIDFCLEVSGLRGHFVAIAAGDEVSRSKPDPEIFLLAAERLGRDPGRCVAVEDSNHGVRAALGAGMQVVVVPGRAGKGAPATRRAKQPEEIRDSVLELLEL